MLGKIVKIIIVQGVLELLGIRDLVGGVVEVMTGGDGDVADPEVTPSEPSA